MFLSTCRWLTRLLWIWVWELMLCLASFYVIRCPTNSVVSEVCIATENPTRFGLLIAYCNHLICAYKCVVSTSPEHARCFDTLTPAWGLSKFISKRKFVDPSSGYLVGDTCTFGAEVFVFKRPTFECLTLRDVVEPYKGSWTIFYYSKLEDGWKDNFFVLEIVTGMSLQPSSLVSA